MGLHTPGTAPRHSTLVVKIDPVDYVALADAADADGRAIAGYVRQLIHRHLKAAA